MLDSARWPIKKLNAEELAADEAGVCRLSSAEGVQCLDLEMENAKKQSGTKLMAYLERYEALAVIR